MHREPRIAFFDIETSPIRAYIWGPIHEPSVMAVEQDTYLLSFAVKWANRGAVTTYALPDYKNFRKDKTDDSALCRDLWKIMDDADIIVAHNGDSFDIKKSNARFAVHGLNPPAQYKSIDTLKIARRHFKFDSNKLDNLGRYLSVGRKIPNTGKDLWLGCMRGDPKSWRQMRRYNAQDVRLLERVYLKLRPWSNHPNLNLYSGRHSCPTCQSDEIKMRGLTYAKVNIRQRYQCLSCGHAWAGEVVKCNASPIQTARATASRRAATSMKSMRRRKITTATSRSTARANRRANENHRTKRRGNAR